MTWEDKVHIAFFVWVAFALCWAIANTSFGERLRDSTHLGLLVSALFFDSVMLAHYLF